MAVPTFDNTIKDNGKIAEARERARPVWPPVRRDHAPAGAERAAQYLTTHTTFESKEDLEHQTDNAPEYWPEAVMPRLIDALGRLPVDVFDILESGRRDVRFHIQPVLSPSSPPLAEVRPSGPADCRTYVIMLRRVLEQDDVVLRAAIIHELCHVLLDHPAAIGWPRDPEELRRATRGMESEALQLSEEIGFKEETLVLRDIIGRIATERGCRPGPRFGD